LRQRGRGLFAFESEKRGKKRGRGMIKNRQWRNSAGAISVGWDGDGVSSLFFLLVPSLI